MQERNSFDYIVVGAGTAGALMANRLSADPQVRVLLLEAGGKDDYHWIHIPVGYLYCIGNPRTDWCYFTEADKGLNGRQLRYPRGKTLGGCSSINGMIYMRGQARDYEHWADLTGDDGWRWDQVLQAFRAHEDHYRLDPNSQEGWSDAQRREFLRLHSNASDTGNPARKAFNVPGGEWRVEKQRLRWEILDAFAQAAVQAGIPATDDFNRGDNEGVSYFEVNQRGGWRWNTSKAFLRPVKQRANLTVWTGAQVKRLLLDKRGDGSTACTGVELVKGHETVSLRAHKEVVMCAGAVASPQILQLSGVGASQYLQPHGIQTQVELPGVGGNLQDHLQIRSVFKVSNVSTLNTRAGSLWGKGMIGAEYLLRRSGPMSMSPSQLGAFTRSSDRYDHANIQFHVQPLSLEAFGDPLHTFDAFTASVCNLQPTSRGSVRLKSGNFQDAPAIAPNYLSTEEDRQVAADSLRVTRRIIAQPALARYQPEEHKPGVQYQSDEDLARLAGDIATTIFHPVGTCKMGREDDPQAVVDSHLRVYDGRGGRIAGLRVVDASIMPTITHGNTNSPTLMIAEKAAQWIRSGQ